MEYIIIYIIITYTIIRYTLSLAADKKKYFLMMMINNKKGNNTIDWTHHEKKGKEIYWTALHYHNKWKTWKKKKKGMMNKNGK